MRMRLARPLPLAGPGDGLARAAQATTRIEVLLRVFYVFPAFWLATHLPLLQPLWSPPPAELVWPVAWLAWVGPEWGAPVVLVLFGVSALLAPLRPDLRIVRLAVALGLLEVLALSFSFGKIHHLMHATLFTSVIFAVFLPDAAFRPAGASRRERALTLRAFSAAQGMLCLTYSLAGVGKLLGTVYQGALGQMTPLHPNALAVHIADRLLQTYPETTLGPWMIAHAPWLWPAMLATLYIQTFALAAAFRPRLHRLWALGLIGFHAVTALSMTIDFTPNIMLVGLLLAASPFAPSHDDQRRLLADLPVVGGLFRGAG